jgi:hypothetical protein
MYSLALIIFVVSEKKAFEHFVLYKLYVFCSDKKFKMAATAGLCLIKMNTIYRLKEGR